MSGKHGRRFGRATNTGGGTTLTARDEDRSDAAEPALAVETSRVAPHAGPIIVYAPEPRLPPTPPSLPPIRTTPLPEFTQPVTAGPLAPEIEMVSAPSAEVVAPPVEVVAPPVEVVAPPVEVVAPPVEVVAPPVVAVPPPVKTAPPPVKAVAPPVEIVAPPIKTVAPKLASAPPLAPASPRLASDLILPVGFGARDAARQERSRQRRRILAIVAAVVVLALLGWWAFSGSSTKKGNAVAAAVGRTQSTLLIQVRGQLGAAADSALVAHDTAAHSGVVVLVPADVITQVPGFGTMSFGQSLSVNDPTAPSLALSDMIGVTVDGSWTLTPAALAALVDKVGGVTVTVDRDVTTTAANGVTTIVVPAGTQKLSGQSAVAYATFLAPGETEPARLARFNGVFEQILAQLPAHQSDLTTALAGLGSGSVSSIPLPKLALLLAGLASDNSSSALSDQLLPVIQLDNGDGQSSSTLNVQATATLVNNQLAGSIPAIRAATGNRVYVQNQVGTPGLGETTRLKLQNAGFVYIQGDNTDDMPNSSSPSAVLIFGSTANDIAQGDAVATALGLPTSDVKLSNSGVTVADIVVKLGVDYKQ